MRNLGFFTAVVSALVFFSGMVKAQGFSTVVFSKGENGFDTYRIPAMVVTKEGTLLAFAEARKFDVGDAGDIDLVVKRSSDGGRTWGEIITVWDSGNNTCGNPAPVVDRNTGDIVLPMTWNKGTDKEWDIHRRTSEDTRRVFVTRSNDDGLTWAEPVEITPSVKQPEWTWFATGPCHAVQLAAGPHKGRIVVPCNHGLAGRFTVSFVIYSDDGGVTWQQGGSPDDGNECSVAELANGNLMLNMRNVPGEGEHYRLVALSDDGGESFGPISAVPGQPEPVCQANIINYAPKGKPGKTLFFSNPHDTRNRSRMTVLRSDNSGETWYTAFTVYEGPSAYSDLTVLPDGGLGILYENGSDSPYEQITFSFYPKETVKACKRRRVK